MKKEKAFAIIVLALALLLPSGEALFNGSFLIESKNAFINIPLNIVVFAFAVWLLIPSKKDEQKTQ